MIKTIILALLLLCSFAQAQTVNSNNCYISSGTVTCGSNSLTPGSGSVSSVSITTANGVSGSVATATTTPAISLTLGAITPTTVAIGGASLVGSSNLAFGIGSGTQLALNGCTIGSDALCSAGLVKSTQFGSASSSLSATTWTTAGIRYKNLAASYTDNTASGTVATAYTDLWPASTILASNSTTYTNYFGAYFVDPIASTNVTMTNKWALGADSVKIAGSMTVLGATVILSGLASDGGATDATVCVKASDGTILKGSGTLGICLGTSSMRYKHDIVPQKDGLEQIIALKPKNYRYNKGYIDDGIKEQYGFLAEDVISIIPKLVGIDKDGKPNTVDIVGMIPILTKAIQEQQEQINQLKNK